MTVEEAVDRAFSIILMIALAGFLVLMFYLIPWGIYEQGMTRGQCEGLGFDHRYVEGDIDLCCNDVGDNVVCESLEFLLTKGE